jgi:hypothetical protein
MTLKRKRRLHDGSLGPLEPVKKLPDINPQLVMAFEAIANQNELIALQQEEIKTLNEKVKALEGAGA